MVTTTKDGSHMRREQRTVGTARVDDPGLAFRAIKLKCVSNQGKTPRKQQ